MFRPAKAKILLSKLMFTKKINGLNLVASPRQINDTIISQIKSTHADWVSLMPFAFMKDGNSPILQYNSDRQWWGERKEGIRETVVALKKRGVSIMLKPQIWIGFGSFTGHVKFSNEESWQIFERQYEIFILDFAKVAEETKCEMFCIGTELNSFVITRPLFWNSLIKKIRASYSGQITYAENWDTYQTVPFWNQLDHIGVDAYFPLSNKKNPTRKELENGWENYEEDLEYISKKNAKPILFTEYGYRSCEYATKEP